MLSGAGRARGSVAAARGHSQPEPPGLQVLLVLLQHPVALEVAAATQAFHNLQEADLAAKQARQQAGQGTAALGGDVLRPHPVALQ